MKFHKFNFDLQRELEWISEKVTVVPVPMEIQSLLQTQGFGKKQEEEEVVNNHSVLVVGSSKKLLSGPGYTTEVVTNAYNLTDA